MQSSRTKRCQKGKSCGATCINRGKLCLVDLPKEPSKNLGKFSKKVGNSLQSKPPTFQSASKPLDLEGRGQVEDTFDHLTKSSVKTENIRGIISADKVNWEAGLGKGAEFVASGLYGAFVEVPPERLAKGLEGKFPGGVGVKYGHVTKEEVELLKKAGESGGVPKLIAAKVEVMSGGNVADGRGMVAMERVPGNALDKLYESGRLAQRELEDGYLKGISNLHKVGIMHGDAHLGNAILQPDGKVRFVDLGRAKLDPQEALREALRGVSEYGPTYNLSMFTGAVATKMRDNYERYKGDFESYKKANPYEDNSKLAMDLIHKLYEGI